MLTDPTAEQWHKRFASADELRSDDSRIADSGNQYAHAKAAAQAAAAAFEGRDVQVSVQGSANAPGTPAEAAQLESITITVSAKPSDQAPPLVETRGNVAGKPDKTAVSRTSPVQHGGADAANVKLSDDEPESVVRGRTPPAELDVAEDDMDGETHGRAGRKTAAKAPSKPAKARGR